MNGLRGIVCVMLCLSFWLPVPGQATAATAIQVTTLADNLAVDGKCSLREAILAANRDQAVDACPAGSGADVISVPEGTITLSVPGGVENEGLKGDLDIYSEMTIIGAGMEKTIIDANQIDRIFDIGETVYRPVEIRDLTVQNGFLLLDAFEYGGDEEHLADGAGIRLLSIQTTLRLVRVRVHDNFADDYSGGDGGGIYSEGRLEIYDSRISSNGAFYGGGGIYAQRDMLLDGVEFLDNYGYGEAAFYVGPGALAEVEDVILRGNHCGPGGWEITVRRGGSLVMNHFLVEESECENATIYNEGSLTLTNGIFANNHPGLYQSETGVIQHHDGNLLVRNTWFRQNLANAALTITGGDARIEESLVSDMGGAGLLVAGGSVTLRNSTISPSADYTGTMEGVRVEGGFLLLENTTLAGLRSEPAALQVNGGNVIVHNSLIAGNRTEAGLARDCALAPGTTVSAGYNLIGAVDSCGWRSGEGDIFGTRADPLDPRLGPLTENGPDRTATRPLLYGSPAIDAADPEVCPAVDQRGVSRPQGRSCDIGAHEAQADDGLGYVIFLPVAKK